MDRKNMILIGAAAAGAWFLLRRKSSDGAAGIAPTPFTSSGGSGASWGLPSALTFNGVSKPEQIAAAPKPAPAATTKPPAAAPVGSFGAGASGAKPSPAQPLDPLGYDPLGNPISQAVKRPSKKPAATTKPPAAAPTPTPPAARPPAAAPTPPAAAPAVADTGPVFNPVGGYLGAPADYGGFA